MCKVYSNWEMIFFVSYKAHWLILTILTSIHSVNYFDSGLSALYIIPGIILIQQRPQNTQSYCENNVILLKS